MTGAASGLGKATAQRIIKEGGKVLMIDLPGSKGEEVAKSFGENALFFGADVTNEAQVNIKKTFLFNGYHILKNTNRLTRL